MTTFNRKLNRTMARKLYERFSEIWRRDLRLSGLYGKKDAPKKPTFGQWYKMHERQVEQMQESTPQDVLEYMGEDPWASQLDPQVSDSVDENRGVVTIPIAGDDNDE